MKNTNQRKFKTTEQEKDDILKYYLLSQSFKAKQFYSDGDFANQLASTVLANQTTQRGNLYNDVDNIGLLISSDLFTQPTSDGINMRNRTLKKISDFTEKVENDMRNGTITEDVYNNIKSYLDFVAGDALKNSVGNKGTKQYDTVFKSGIPQKLSSFISSKIAVPIPQQTNLQIPEAPVNIGIPAPQQSSFGVDEQTLMEILKNSDRIISRLRNDGKTNIAIKEYLKVYLEKMYEQNPTLQVGKLYSYLTKRIDTPSVQFQETKNASFQPAQPELNQVIRGEKNTYAKYTDKYVPEPNDRADKHQAGQDIERTEDYAMTKIMNQRQLYTETYGVAPRLFDKIMEGIDDIIITMNRNNVPFENRRAAIEKHLIKLKESFPELDAENLYLVIMRQIEDSMRSNQNDDDQTFNVVNSKKAIHGDRLKDAVQNYQQFDSNQGDEREPPPKSTPQAQVQFLNPEEQLMNSLSYYRDNNYIDTFVSSIINGQIPASSVHRTQKGRDMKTNAYFNNVEKELRSINGQIQNLSLLYNRGIELSAGQLRDLKYAFSLQSYRILLGKLERIGSEYSDEKTDEKERYIRSKEIISEMIASSQKNTVETKPIMMLKSLLSSSTDNPLTVYKTFIKSGSPNLPPIYSSTRQNIYRGEGKKPPRNVAEKPVYPVSAKTSYVSQSVNQYSVGNTTYLT